MLKFRFVTIAAVAFCLAVSACAVPRGPSTMCSTAFMSSAGTKAVRASGTDPNDVIERAVERLIDDQSQRNKRAGKGPTATINYLLMSTGGQYGAFGSGFLAGWSANAIAPRPDFSVVTGASAGGVLAPLAFLGSDFDASLPFRDGLGLADVGRPKSPLALATSTSVLDPGPYEALVRRTVSDRFVKALGAKSGPSRSAFVGVVNLDTGRFEIIDLGRMAREEKNPKGCITEAILATSAIPLVFPPRNVNDNLFADAGLRDHLFLNAVREGIRRATARGVRTTTNAYIIINGNFGKLDSGVTNSLPGIATRSMSIASDEGLRKSVMEVLRLAEITKWNIKAIAAPRIDPAACKSKGESGIGQGLFDKCVTKALFEAGERLGSSAHIPWLTTKELRDLAAQR